MKWFKELNMDQLMIFWLSLIFLGAFAEISYDNYLDYKLNLHVLQCVEKTQNAELCNKVLKK
jgi:hypothetical protein